MTDCIIGIDPGITGGIALIDGDNHMVVIDIPTRPRLNGTGKEVDLHVLHHVFGEWDRHYDNVLVFFEQVNAMPGGKGKRKMGATSAFTFGRNVGQLEGLVASFDWAIRYVRPQQWKSRAGLLGKDKDAARTLAQNMYPSLRDKLSRTKDIGRADALMVATFGEKR